MANEIIIKPIGHVTFGRKETIDDYWGDSKAVIALDAKQFSQRAIQGLDSFSHIEVIFYFHLVNDQDILTADSHPRGNPVWPKMGIFAQRKKDRPNKIGVSICTIDKIENNFIHVLGLDAVEGTPIIDIKPVMTGFVPNKTEIREPEWAKTLMCAYYKNKDEIDNE